MIYVGDVMEFFSTLEDDSIDLIIGSPPYEFQRSYGLGKKLVTGQEWVDWMVAVWRESQRVCKGLVCYVVEGRTKDFRWSATPALLMADLHREGLRLRKPPIYHRSGIPGSGGPDWWRNDYEFCICTSKGKLPWSDNTASGKPPKFPPGGEMSYRDKEGNRKNGIGHPIHRDQSKRAPNKQRNQDSDWYLPPAIANPGNVIRGSGSNLGSKLAHENEAPYPEWLVDPFIRCFCPPAGLVCDPFVGSGTTAKVALNLDRRFIGCDLRESQKELTLRRLALECPGKV